MDEPEVVNGFFGVYLLYSLNEKPENYGRTYIGFTVNPVRRNRQHNIGTRAGGAKNTNNRGPWKMILIIHGFPNNIAALRFEWAWQHPERSRRLTHVKSKRRTKKESQLEFRVRILSEMLRVGPWKRLPLIIRWIDSSFYTEFAIEKQAPLHMAICYGPVTVASQSQSQSKSKSSPEEDAASRTLCSICREQVMAGSGITCPCALTVHKPCLAETHLDNEPGEFVPVEVTCPGCHHTYLWGDLIRGTPAPGPRKGNTGEGDHLIWEVSDDHQQSSMD